jgi:SAM-dependent methyltransferase
MELNENFWEGLYQEQDTGWDIGYPSPPLQEYIDQLTDPSISILIPGCGRSYEGEYLYRSGFENVHLLDYAPSAFGDFTERVPDFPKDQIFLGDFFEHEGQYDLILEQTFFCALNPSLRNDYAKHMSKLLKPNGKLVGVLFNTPMNEDKPPYGGNAMQYMSIFQPYFKHLYFKPAYNSIEPRMGRELFMKLDKD